MGQGSSLADDGPKECSDVKVNKFSHEWTIKNFSHSRSVLYSSAFPHSDDDQFKLRLELYPYRFNLKWKKKLSLYLRLVSGSAVSAKFKLILANARRKIIEERQGVYDFNPGSDSWLIVCSRRQVLRCLEPEGDLTVRCEVAVLGQSRVDQFNVPDCSLVGDLGQMLHTRRFADCVLEVEGREIQAHKNLLAARSPVFSAMFEHETHEAATGRVLVPDVELAVMEELVHFIYTGKAPNLSAMSERLMVAADKYQLQRLKVMCEANLWKNLNHRNACNTLVLADLHSATQLKTRAIRFINSNADQVTETHGWEKMNQQQPHLLMEIFKAKDS